MYANETAQETILLTFTSESNSSRQSTTVLSLIAESGDRLLPECARRQPSPLHRLRRYPGWQHQMPVKAMWVCTDEVGRRTTMAHERSCCRRHRNRRLRAEALLRRRRPLSLLFLIGDPPRFGLAVPHLPEVQPDCARREGVDLRLAAILLEGGAKASDECVEAAPSLPEGARARCRGLRVAEELEHVGAAAPGELERRAVVPEVLPEGVPVAPLLRLVPARPAAAIRSRRIARAIRVCRRHASESEIYSCGPKQAFLDLTEEKDTSMKDQNKAKSSVLVLLCLASQNLRLAVVTNSDKSSVSEN
ncbi:hypothetical protein GW17_00052550 [Ensete ventricosum]|nr:hypothetical protein GW17_00052550 [Ensete ventricosum]